MGWAGKHQRGFLITGLGFVAFLSHAELVLTDNRDDWSVGYTSLLGIQLSANNIGLKDAIPRLLMEELASIRYHKLDTKEQLNYARKLLFEAIQMGEEQILFFQQHRDEQALLQLDTSDLEKNISLLLERRQELNDFNPNELEVASSKPVSVITRPDGRLFPVSKLVPFTKVIEPDLDLLVTGKIREIEGELLLEYYALDQFKDAPIFSFQKTFPRELVMETIDELASGLASILLGEQWATLYVIPTPEQAAVYINDEFVGLGDTTLPYMSMGHHSVLVTASGYKPLEQLILLGREDYEVAVSLMKLPKKTVNIITDPSGASVYIEAEYVGNTPLKLRLPQEGFPIIILFRMEDHHDKSVILDVNSTNEVNVKLVQQTSDLFRQQKLQRRDFYDQLGVALISIAGPLILFTAANEPSANNRELLLGGGVVSTALSGVLIARAAVALGNYLRSADRRVP